MGPVFHLNSRWSIDPNVPVLGSEEDDIQNVLKFYEFWRSFKSWREFSAGEEEFDLEDAECREERRYMERQNKKVTKQLKKDEHARIMALVNLAEKYDPRVIAHKDAQEKERIRKKEEWNKIEKKEKKKKELHQKQKQRQSTKNNKKNNKLCKTNKLERKGHNYENFVELPGKHILSSSSL